MIPFTVSKLASSTTGLAPLLGVLWAGNLGTERARVLVLPRMRFVPLPNVGGSLQGVETRPLLFLKNPLLTLN